VEFVSGAGGRLLGSVNWGAQPQVVTQWLSAAESLAGREAAAASDNTRTVNFKFLQQDISMR
jgi:hypothetical protein